MICPTCKVEADCIDSRPLEDTRRRRYRCGCGGSFTTIEVHEHMTDFSALNVRSAVYRWFKRISGIHQTQGREQVQVELRKALGIQSFGADMIYPMPGDKWRLKRDHEKVATVLHVVVGALPNTGQVQISAPWMQGDRSGKSLDTFLKQYERLPLESTGGHDA